MDCHYLFTGKGTVDAYDAKISDSSPDYADLTAIQAPRYGHGSGSYYRRIRRNFSPEYDLVTEIIV
jgi:hypothetical protein